MFSYLKSIFVPNSICDDVQEKELLSDLGVDVLEREHVVDQGVVTELHEDYGMVSSMPVCYFSIF